MTLTGGVSTTCGIAQTPPDNDEMERLTADSGFTLDVLDKKAREVYDCAYSTTYQRYQTAIAMLIDDLLGVL